ncbi:MAG: serine hydrolase domain-containing protein [Chitinophagales bacterium]
MHSQSLGDSIRLKYQLPELAYAVVSADSVLEIHLSGIKQRGGNHPAELTDRFRIGSNTKAITAYIAMRLVQQGLLSWQTKFAELFPALKKSMRPAYRNYTLLNLLTFRCRLPKWTYTNAQPSAATIAGSAVEQRMQFALWILRQKPVHAKDSINFSNPAYVLAGLMLEKASGKSYEQLIQDLATELHIEIGFGAPNTSDTLQPCGHDADLAPETNNVNPRLNWLMAAGNLNLSLPDYIRFIQLQLKGLQNGDGQISKQQYQWLHHGFTRFALGWFNHTEQGKQYSFNTGNPGTFLSHVLVADESNRALIIFTNVQSPEAEQAVKTLTDSLRLRYRF